MLDRAHANEKIEFVTPYEIVEVHDVTKKSVEMVTLRNTVDNSTKIARRRRRFRRHRPRPEYQGL